MASLQMRSHEFIWRPNVSFTFAPLLEFVGILIQVTLATTYTSGKFCISHASKGEGVKKILISIESDAEFRELFPYNSLYKI